MNDSNNKNTSETQNPQGSGEQQNQNQGATSTGNPSPDKKPEIPSELRAQIDTLIEAARQQEKNKLYVTINDLKTDLKSSNDRLSAVMAELSTLKNLFNNKDNNTDETSKTETKSETKSESKSEQKAEVKTDKSSSELDELKKQLEALREDIVKRDERAKVEREAEKHKEAVAKYREQVIVGLPAELAELVPADTKENVDKFVNNLKLGMEKVMPTPAPLARSGSLLTAGTRTPGTPAQGINIQGQPITAETINAMTPEQYLKFRQENPQLISGAQRPGFETQKFGGMTLRRQ